MQRPADLAKLSGKWQTYVASLEIALKHANAALDERLGVADEKTKVFLHNYRMGPDRPLPEFGLVRFRMGDDIDEYVDVQRAMEPGGGVVIRSGRAIMLEPRASNTALVHMSKR